MVLSIYKPWHFPWSDRINIEVLKALTGQTTATLLRHADRRHQGGAEKLNVQAAIRYRFRPELSPGVLGVAMNIPTLITLAFLAYPIYYAAYLSFHKVSLAELAAASSHSSALPTTSVSSATTCSL